MEPWPWKHVRMNNCVVDFCTVQSAGVGVTELKLATERQYSVCELGGKPAVQTGGRRRKKDSGHSCCEETSDDQMVLCERSWIRCSSAEGFVQKLRLRGASVVSFKIDILWKVRVYWKKGAASSVRDHLRWLADMKDDDVRIMQGEMGKERMLALKMMECWWCSISRPISLRGETVSYTLTNISLEWNAGMLLYITGSNAGQTNLYWADCMCCLTAVCVCVCGWSPLVFERENSGMGWGSSVCFNRF